MNKTYGYVRVSTDEQTSNSQRDAIIARFPTASILADDGISGTVPPRERPALGILLNQLLQEDDTLVIYAIDRIGRNARDTLELVEELEKRKITLVSIREGVDLSSAVGQAVLGVMASFAQMERKLILERQAAGIEAAKSRGQKFGRPTKIGAKEAGEIVMRRAMGVPIATIASTYMRLGHHTLALCCNHGPLHNLDDAGNKLSAKIHCGTANPPPGQFILYLLLFFTAGRHGQSYGRPADHDTGQPARRLFYYINHLLTLLSAILPCYLQTLRLRSETIITN